MSGEKHLLLGVGIAATVGGYTLATYPQKTLGAFIVIGSVLGSIMPDIDVDKSKMSSAVNKVIIYSIMGIFLIRNMGVNIGMGDITRYITGIAPNPIALWIFIGNMILARLSPHRVYTHRILGSAIFCGSALFLFNKGFAVGFILGYSLHLLADRLTKRGKYMKFYKLSLPLMDSKGKLCISL